MRKTDVPVYELTLKPLEEGGMEASGFDKIAYVDEPAMEEMGVYLSTDQVNKLFKFSNMEKQQVVAPLLIPYKEIDRNDNGHYKIKFTPEVIKELQARAEAEGKLSDLNTMKDTHKGGVAPSFILENWIIEDENDKAYTVYGFSQEKIPVGTWMVITQVIDKDYWENEIKKNKKFSYSIEAFLNMKLTNLQLNKIDNMEKEKEVKLATLPEGAHEIAGKIYIVDAEGAIVEVKDVEEKAEVEAAEEKPSDAKEELAEDAKPEEEVKAEEDKPEEVKAAEDEVKPEEEVKAEEDKPEEEVKAVEEEAAPEGESTESESKDEDKFEAIFEEIAALKSLISGMNESSPEEANVQMSSQKNDVGTSISALANLIKSNK